MGAWTAARGVPPGGAWLPGDRDVRTRAAVPAGAAGSLYNDSQSRRALQSHVRTMAARSARGLGASSEARLDELAADCAADGRYEFLLTAKPLNLTGGVGSPPNAIAIK